MHGDCTAAYIYQWLISQDSTASDLTLGSIPGRLGIPFEFAAPAWQKLADWELIRPQRHYTIISITWHYEASCAQWDQLIKESHCSSESQAANKAHEEAWKVEKEAKAAATRKKNADKRSAIEAAAREATLREFGLIPST